METPNSSTTKTLQNTPCPEGDLDEAIVTWRLYNSPRWMVQHSRISGQWTEWTSKNSLCGSDSLATYRLLVPLKMLFERELTCSARCNECKMTHLIHFNPVVLDKKQQKSGQMWLTDSQSISSFPQVILSKSHEAICKNLGESHPQALLVGHIIYSLYRVSKLPDEDIPI